MTLQVTRTTSDKHSRHYLVDYSWTKYAANGKVFGIGRGRCEFRSAAKGSATIDKHARAAMDKDAREFLHGRYDLQMDRLVLLPA